MRLSDREADVLSRQLGVAALAGLSLQRTQLLVQQLLPVQRVDGLGMVEGFDGRRWFENPEEAVADAIFRAARVPELRPVPWRVAVPAPVRNEDGLWAMPWSWEVHLRRRDGRR